MECNHLYKEAMEAYEEKLDVDFEDNIAKHGLDDILYDYSEDMFKPINKGYLNGKPSKELSKVFEVNGNYDGIAYRGTHLDSNLLSQLEEGDIISNKMPLSSSKDEYSVEQYIQGKQSNRKNTKKVILKIDTKNNPQYDISDYTSLDEMEVLIAPKTKLQVEGVDRNKNPIEIEMTIMHPEIQNLYSSVGAKQITNLMGTGAAIANILKYEGKGELHKDRNTIYGGVDRDKYNRRILKAIGYEDKDLYNPKLYKEIGTKYMKYVIKELDKASPFSKLINEKIVNMAMNNDHLIKNIKKMTSLPQLEHYLMYGSKHHKYGRLGSSYETRRAHRTLRDLNDARATNPMRHTMELLMLKEKQNGKILKQSNGKDTKIYKAFKEGDQKAFKKAFNKGYMKILGAANYNALIRELE